MVDKSVLLILIVILIAWILGYVQGIVDMLKEKNK